MLPWGANYAESYNTSRKVLDKEAYDHTCQDMGGVPNDVCSVSGYFVTQDPGTPCSVGSYGVEQELTTAAYQFSFTTAQIQCGALSSYGVDTARRTSQISFEFIDSHIYYNAIPES